MQIVEGWTVVATEKYINFDERTNPTGHTWFTPNDYTDDQAI